MAAGAAAFGPIGVDVVCETPAGYDSAGGPKLLDRVRIQIRRMHYSRRTEVAYVSWIRRFILFHEKRHPLDMGASEAEQFLSWLASEKSVSASTQNQALSAILFLYRQVLGRDLPWLDDVVPAKRPAHLPVVLTRDEVREIFERMDGTSKLIAQLLYGSGLRLLEACRLRVKDVDFATQQLAIRSPKNGRDRAVGLPASLVDPLRAHMEVARRQHESDLARGAGSVALPGAIARKYPAAARELAWQWVFPASAGRTVTPTAASYAAITSTNRWFSAPYEQRSSHRASPNARPATPSATRSRPTCSRTATTSVPCKPCSGTAA